MTPYGTDPGLPRRPRARSCSTALARETGASRSELIRRAVNATYGQSGAEEKLAALRASAGSWGRRRRPGADYVEALRGGDVNERLARLGAR